MNALRLLPFSLVLLPTLATAQKIPIPCESPTVAVAADGSGLWLACSRNWKEIKQAKKQGQPPPAANASPTDVYWLDMATETREKIASANADIRVIAAPTGSRALIVMPQQRSWGHAFLYEGKQRVKELPVDSYFLLWSSDSQKVYFRAGSTVQADGWNILGVYDLSSGTITHVKLQEPTEILRVCPSSGKVYSAIPQYPGFAGSTVEYTDTVQFVQRIHAWMGAQFSAGCSYVASESGSHGLLPWAIYDTTNGKKLFQFAADEDAKGGAFSLVCWNPKHESVLLREHISEGHEPLIEVFDVRSGRVLQTVPQSDSVEWSADGNSIIVANGASLNWSAVKLSLLQHHE